MARDRGYSRQDLERLRREVESASPDAAVAILAGVAHDIDSSAPVEGIIRSNDDTIGLTIAGAIRRFQAWKARGALIAAMTSDNQFHAYFDLAGLAREHLGAANRLAPTYGLAAGLLASLSIDAEPGEKTHAEWLLSQAEGVPAQCYCDVVTGWATKWGGSQDQMWRSLHRLWDPANLATAALIPRCHWEQQLHTEVLSARQDYVARFEDPPERPDLQQASDRALALDPGQVDPALLRFIDGWFAFAFFNRGAKPRMKKHLQRLGRHMDPAIWLYGSIFLSPQARFRLARAQVGLF